VVGARRVNAVFIGYDLPELRADLVPALACLDVNNFTHHLLNLTDGCTFTAGRITFSQLRQIAGVVFELPKRLMDRPDGTKSVMLKFDIVKDLHSDRREISPEAGKVSNSSL
jgi:hypothetical protein